jgi:hypothetical protein
MNTIIDLPDFNDLLSYSKLIGALNRKKELLTVEIKEMESSTILTVTGNHEYWIAGKPPSFSFVENTYMYTGIGGEIIPKRKELAKISGDLEEAKSTLEVMLAKIEVWRTQMANQRASLG